MNFMENIEIKENDQEKESSNTFIEKFPERVLPSNCQINQVVNLKFRENDVPFTAVIRGIHFYNSKVKYDVGIWLGDGSVDSIEEETRIYNVDSYFVRPA